MEHESALVMESQGRDPALALEPSFAPRVASRSAVRAQEAALTSEIRRLQSQDLDAVSLALGPSCLLAATLVSLADEFRATGSVVVGALRDPTRDGDDLAAAGTSDKGRTYHQDIVAFHVPVTGNDGVPMGIERFAALVGEVLREHGGASFRSAHGVFTSSRRTEIDALVEVEIWTRHPEKVCAFVRRWAAILRQRVMCVRVFRGVEFYDIPGTP